MVRAMLIGVEDDSKCRIRVLNGILKDRTKTLSNRALCDSKGRICGIDSEVASRPYLLPYNNNNNKSFMCWYECPCQDFSYSQIRKDFDLNHPKSIFDIMAMRSRGLACQPDVELVTISDWNQLEELLKNNLCAKDYQASIEKHPRDRICRSMSDKTKIKVRKGEDGKVRGIIYLTDWVAKDEEEKNRNRFSMIICIVPSVLFTLIGLRLMNSPTVAFAIIVRSLIVMGFTSKIFAVVTDVRFQDKNSNIRQLLSTIIFGHLVAAIINTGIFIVNGINREYQWDEKKWQNRSRKINKVHWPDDEMSI
ncbi:hypothetical protein QAD02_009968 [Eretmocerus hayati]|uniref:Uncharacterized protein n=1 Tax=Eretmocerus hayati TaxID=131215 RepID=A0ACC2NAU3_9HYME|nr:hypothetical protein QAD02_009968 [Eretmocerus hayati]